MFSKKLLTKKVGFLFLIMAGLFLMNINFIEAVGWVPITDISSIGIPADTEVTLSDFIIVIYDFLLSAVGIAAMFMIVVGGFRYLTAAGNAAALSEAKDIIYSALYGLLLALCVWIIVSTINPDLVYLKKPGTTVSHGDYSCLPSGSVCIAGDNCCYGTCTAAKCPERPLSCIDPTWPLNGDDGGNCKCIDGATVGLVPFVNCNAACQNPANYHCIKMIARYGVFDFAIPLTAENAKEYSRETTAENPLISDFDDWHVHYIDYISMLPLAAIRFDTDRDGVYESPTIRYLRSPPFLMPPIPPCCIALADGGISCETGVEIEDSAGNKAHDVIYCKLY